MQRREVPHTDNDAANGGQVYCVTKVHGLLALRIPRGGERAVRQHVIRSVVDAHITARPRASGRERGDTHDLASPRGSGVFSCGVPHRRCVLGVLNQQIFPHVTHAVLARQPSAYTQPGCLRPGTSTYRLTRVGGAC